MSGTNLDGFRGPDVEADPSDRVPALTPDSPETGATTIVRQPAPDPAPEADEAPAEPTLVVDPRLALAAKFNRRRGEQHATAQIIDPDGPPVDAQQPGAITGTPQTEAARIQAGTPEGAPDPAADRLFSLRVNRNDFQVTRSQLLAAAEIDEADAKDIPEYALVKIAQKNLAAQARLDETKALSQTARLTARAPDDTTSEQPFQADARSTPPALPADDDAELMQRIQLGDPAEAMQAFDALSARREQARTYQSRIQSLQQDVDFAVQDFGRNNPDIAQNQLAADFLRTIAVREAVDELRGIGLPDHELQTLLNSPELATRAYNGARMQGLQVRSPAELFACAGQKVRAALNLAAPNPTPNPSPAPLNSRIEMKRALPTQPARSGSADVSSGSQPAPQPRNPSDVIASMRAARHQG